MAFVTMCSGGPRAGLLNEFPLPMWHCCDNRMPRQACSFRLRVFVFEGNALSLFYDRDVTFPALCVFSNGQRKRERESWLNNSRSTSVKLHILPKSPQMGFNTRSHDYTLVVSAGHSACQGLITLRVVQLVTRLVSTGHCKTRGSPQCKKIFNIEFITRAGAFCYCWNDLWLTSQLCSANASVI